MARKSQKEHIIAMHETTRGAWEGDPRTRDARLSEGHFQASQNKFSKKTQTFSQLFCIQIYLCEGEQSVVVQEQRQKQDL